LRDLVICLWQIIGGAAFALAQQPNNIFWFTSLLLDSFGIDLIQILSISLDQFFEWRPPDFIHRFCNTEIDGKALVFYYACSGVGDKGSSLII